nr:DUF3558 domain-containing protein [Pseudonocardia spinosispora]
MRWLPGALVALTVGLAGCGSGPAETSTPAPPPTSPPASTRPPLPPRPAELRLDNVDPCSLLNPAQEDQLLLGPAMRNPDPEEFGATSCAWVNGVGPSNTWSIRTIPGQGTEYYLGASTGYEMIKVGGFTALQSAPDNAPRPDRACIIHIDVAAGQSLAVTYDNLPGDLPGINQQVACQQAAKVGEMAVANLRKLAH